MRKIKKGEREFFEARRGAASSSNGKKVIEICFPKNRRPRALSPLPLSLHFAAAAARVPNPSPFFLSLTRKKKGALRNLCKVKMKGKRTHFCSLYTKDKKKNSPPLFFLSSLSSPLLLTSLSSFPTSAPARRERGPPRRPPAPTESPSPRRPTRTRTEPACPSSSSSSSSSSSAAASIRSRKTRATSAASAASTNLRRVQLLLQLLVSSGAFDVISSALRYTSDPGVLGQSALEAPGSPLEKRRGGARVGRQEALRGVGIPQAPEGVVLLRGSMARASSELRDGRGDLSRRPRAPMAEVGEPSRAPPQRVRAWFVLFF